MVISLAGNDSVYKDRYERVLRELDFTKKRLQKQHEEELELEHNLKKAVEKRVSFYSICILLSYVMGWGINLYDFFMPLCSWNTANIGTKHHSINHGGRGRIVKWLRLLTLSYLIGIWTLDTTSSVKGFKTLSNHFQKYQKFTITYNLLHLRLWYVDVVTVIA